MQTPHLIFQINFKLLMAHLYIFSANQFSLFSIFLKDFPIIVLIKIGGLDWFKPINRFGLITRQSSRQT